MAMNERKRRKNLWPGETFWVAAEARRVPILFFAKSPLVLASGSEESHAGENANAHTAPAGHPQQEMGVEVIAVRVVLRAMEWRMRYGLRHSLWLPPENRTNAMARRPRRRTTRSGG